MDAFERLLDLARGCVSGKGDMAQVILLETGSGRVCSAHIPDPLTEDMTSERKLLEDVGRERIRRIVCLWAQGSVDLPSIGFRRLVLELDPSNADAEILVLCGDGYRTRTLANTMPN